jgi:RimJ/RimL family protein N-acetyltransferase
MDTRLDHAGAPTLTTERLVLRAHRPDDFEAYHGIWSDPDVVRHISGKPSTPEESWGRLLRALGHWPVMGFGYWAAVERSSGRLVGEFGLADFHREITPSLDGAPEAGWVLSPSVHGRGLATEAMQAVIGWADRTLQAPRIVCIISPENPASIRVAAKCGFRDLCLTSYRGEPTLMMERL